MNFKSVNILNRPAVLKYLLITGFSFLTIIASATPPKIRITIAPNQQGLITNIIQQAIDSCGENGGGVVFFPSGKYLTGGIQLKSRVTLQTEKGTIILGSDDYINYKNDAFIFGENVTGIAILGEGIIDGADCQNPKGEEGFRGPHCIRLVYCSNISIKDITIKNSANWAINCRYCSNAVVENVSIRGGHDGLHTRFCSKFTVTRCDFRTGDDAVAGNDNRDFLVTDCKINTSCNGFRFGCYNFKIQRCKFWGPGEYVHKLQGRNNMLTAFVHFSPEDESPQLQSDNWIMEDITVDNVDYFYMYNYAAGLWQTGQPAAGLKLSRIKATNLLGAFNIIGDSRRKFKLSVQNSSFTYREGANASTGFFEGAKIQSGSFFNASNFNQIKLQDVTFKKKGDTPVLACNNGNLLSMKNIKFITGQKSIPYSITDVTETDKDGLPLNTFKKNMNK
jgi:hypothetical protein